MAQQLINTGTAALTGDGESIRSAFVKINSNFTELYESGGVDLTNVSSHILPETNLTYDLGSTSSQWRSLYVGTSTIYIGGTPLTVADGELLVGGNPVQGDTGNVEFRNDSLNSINGITISNGSQTTASTAQITVPANGSGSVSITNSGTSWAFNNNGSLTFPDGSIQTTAARATTSTLVNGNYTVALSTSGNLTLHGDIVGYQTYFNDNPLDERVTIQPSSSVNKLFKFITDQNAGTWQRSQMEFPVAEVNKAVLLGFPHNNNTVGYIYTQGTDTSSTEFNNAFNIMANGTDVKIGVVTGGGNKVWKFDTDSVLTFPEGGVLKSASDDSLTIRTSYLGLTSPPSLQNSDFVFNGNGVLTLPGSGVIESLLDEDFTIRTQYTAMTSPPGPATNNFVFGGNGSLTIPKGITSLANLELLAANYVVIDSQSNGQIEIGRSSGIGDVILGNRSNQTDVVTEGRFIVNSGSQEKFTTKATSTGTVSYDCSGGHVFFHNEYQGANWTANLTNLALETGKATTITIIINQPATGYYPNALEIDGTAQTINWQGNATPTPSSLRYDVVTFSIVNNSVSYIVLGQLTGF